jgi:ATP-dependent Clp protease adaptor protein ClpS
VASKKTPSTKPKRPDLEGATAIEEKIDTKRPRLWRVLMHTDDYTTQEFVVYVLMHFFKKDPTEATAIMLKVHTSGKAIVGLFTKDVAESKVAMVTDAARERGYPLMVTTEPEN